MWSHPRNYNFLFHPVLSFPDNPEYTRGRKLKPPSRIQYWPVETGVPTDPWEEDTRETDNARQSLPLHEFSNESAAWNQLISQIGVN